MFIGKKRGLESAGYSMQQSGISLPVADQQRFFSRNKNLVPPRAQRRCSAVPTGPLGRRRCMPRWAHICNSMFSALYSFLGATSVSLHARSCVELACAPEIQPTTVAAMKTSVKTFTIAGALLLAVAFATVAATPEQEKAFTDKYKAAMEGKDTATLESFLYTEGSDPAALEFYKMMQSGEAGEKIATIELVNLTPEDVKKATTPMDGPTGKVCLNLKPTKKLVIKVEKKDANGSSSSSSENFVAEKNGKFVIPVPGPCK
jgi:hypothetical protein